MEIEFATLAVALLCQDISYRNKNFIIDMMYLVLLNKRGHISEMALGSQDYHFTTFYKFYESAPWSLRRAHTSFVLLLLMFFRSSSRIVVALDDTLIGRSRSKKVPCRAKLHNHNGNANAPDYIYAQNLVVLACVFCVGGHQFALPIFVHLHDYEAEASKPESKNKSDKTAKGKLGKAIKMVRIAENFLKDHNITARLIIVADAWYARQSLLQSTPNTTFITAARHDTALYDEPVKPTVKKSGRPNKYGKRIKMTQSDLMQSHTLIIDGKEQLVQYTSKVAKAHFLDGDSVRAVWLSFVGNPKIYLILSTDFTLSAEDILDLYAQRSLIEVLFNNLKNTVGFSNNWMQKVRTYYRWFYFKSWGYAILKISATQNKEHIQQLVKKYQPWRIRKNGIITVTAGLTQWALSQFFALIGKNGFRYKVHLILNNPNSDHFKQFFDRNCQNSF